MSEDKHTKFLHRCPDCHKRFYVNIQSDVYSVHQVFCPFCNHRILFDNQEGQYDHNEKTNESFDQNFAQPEPVKKPDTALYGAPGSGPKNESPSEKRKIRTALNQSEMKALLGNRFKDFKQNLLSLFDLRQRKTQLWLGVMSVTPLFIFLLFYSSLHFSALWLDDTPRFYLARLENLVPNRIFDRNGQLMAELFSKKTGKLTAADIPESFKTKLLYIEDQNFYNHNGIHWFSILRAAIVNLTAGSYRQGGSTISQQVARILLQDRQKNILRKIKEAALTYRLEDELTKNEILAAYLNHVYLGHGSFGIESAARFYFEKNINELNFVEELVLASLPSAPERYSPLRNPDLLEKKLDYIYNNMFEDDLTELTSVEYNELKARTFQSLNRSPSASIFGTRINYSPYVTEYVRVRLKELFGDEQENSYGLEIHTTIDLNLQKQAVRQTRQHLQQLSSWVRPVRMQRGEIIPSDEPIDKINQEYANLAQLPLLTGLPAGDDRLPDLQAASIGVDPLSGGVLFMQGGAEFKTSNQLNRTISMRRQTGSAIKPFVYSAAIESGLLTASSLIDDTPIFEKVEKKTEDDPDYWLPSNLSGVYEGEIALRRALVYSKNIPAIRTVRKIGLKRVGHHFRKFFFPDPKSYRTRFRSDETVAIGSLEMNPLEMATAYSAFAANGIVRRPYLIKEIKNSSGLVLYDYAKHDEFNTGFAEQQQIIPPQTAHVVNSLLADSGRRGGFSTQMFGDRTAFIGKTGTTNDYRDAWFVGATPDLAAAVWIGYDDPTYSIYRATGSQAAGPLWGKIVSRNKIVNKEFTFEPEAIEALICKDSRQLALEVCPDKLTEYYIDGTEPLVTCEEHQIVEAQLQQPGEVQLSPDTVSTGDFD